MADCWVSRTVDEMVASMVPKMVERKADMKGGQWADRLVVWRDVLMVLSRVEK